MYVIIKMEKYLNCESIGRRAGRGGKPARERSGKNIDFVGRRNQFNIFEREIRGGVV